MTTYFPPPPPSQILLNVAEAHALPRAGVRTLSSGDIQPFFNKEVSTVILKEGRKLLGRSSYTCLPKTDKTGFLFNTGSNPPKNFLVHQAWTFIYNTQFTVSISIFKDCFYVDITFNVYYSFTTCGSSVTKEELY